MLEGSGGEDSDGGQVLGQAAAPPAVGGTPGPSRVSFTHWLVVGSPVEWSQSLGRSVTLAISNSCCRFLVVWMSSVWLLLRKTGPW